MKKSKLKQAIIVIFFISGLMFIQCSNQKAVRKSHNNHNKSKDKRYEFLLSIANELNKKCPFIVDKDTRLDNTLAIPDNIFQYNYTLLNYSKSQLNIKVLKKNLYPRILNQLNSHPDFKWFRDNRIIMVYSYNDKNGVFLFRLKFTYADYKRVIL